MTSMMNKGYDVVSVQDWLAIKHNNKTRLVSGNILKFVNHITCYLFMWDRGSLVESP